MMTATITHSHIPFDMIFNAIFNTMQQHFASNDCCCAAKCSHRIFTSIALQ